MTQQILLNFFFIHYILVLCAVNVAGMPQENLQLQHIFMHFGISA
jgi:hypothetical protein